MADTDRKTEGPACACGKADLYEEWLKQNENEEDTSTPSSQSENQLSSTVAAGKGDTKPVQTKE